VARGGGQRPVSASCAPCGRSAATPPRDERFLQQGLCTTRRRFCFYWITRPDD